jgi:hypothetical protein
LASTTSVEVAAQSLTSQLLRDAHYRAPCSTISLYLSVGRANRLAYNFYPPVQLGIPYWQARGEVITFLHTPKETFYNSIFKRMKTDDREPTTRIK